MIKTILKFMNLLLLMNYKFVKIVGIWKLKNLQIFNKRIKLYYPTTKRIFTIFILKKKKYKIKNLLTKIKYIKVKYFTYKIIFRKLVISPYIFIRDHKKIKKSYIIRAAVPYVKTRYSIIRQECKNIVFLVLLINFIFLYFINSIYLKVQIIIIFKWLILIFVSLCLKNHLSNLYFNLREFVELILNRK